MDEVQRVISLSDALARYPGAESFTFGHSAAMNARILGLVRSGRKTATCEARDTFEARGEMPPVPGRVDTALDGDGKPAVAIRTVSVEQVRCCDVQERHVPAQGEFRDLADWRAGYKAELTRAGFFGPKMEMLVETFELVEDFL